MNVLTFVAVFLFLITAFLCIVVYVARNEALYKRFFIWWLNLWGVPAGLQEHMPMEMYVKQARNMSWLFIFLALVTFSTGLFMVYLGL